MTGGHEEFKEYEVDLNADCLCGCMALGRFHKIYRFPNDYGASVVSSSNKNAGQESVYKIVLLKFTSNETYDMENVPGTDSSTVVCADWGEAATALRTIEEL
jgi:hypothetical protein